MAVETSFPAVPERPGTEQPVQLVEGLLGDGQDLRGVLVEGRREALAPTKAVSLFSQKLL